MKQRLAAMLVVTTLMGCAQQQQTSAQRIQIDKSVCMESLTNLPARSIVRTEERKAPPRKLSEFAFESIASCLKTKKDPIPVSLFKLDGKVPSELHIVINIQQSGAFAAALDLLDEKQRFVRTVPFKNFVKRGSGYTLTEFLNQSDANVRYVVLRPDSQAFGENDASIVGLRNENAFVFVAGSAAFYGNFVTGSEKTASRWLGETGKFSIWIDDYVLEETKKK
jgi:uncharacterized lipoprotein NlpE involved in copper resistance